MCGCVYMFGLGGLWDWEDGQILGRGVYDYVLYAFMCVPTVPLAGTLGCLGCGSCLVLLAAKVLSLLVNCCTPSMVLGEEEGGGREGVPEG